MQPEPQIRYLKSFIFYTLIALVSGMLVGMIQGFVLGGVLGVAGVDVRTIRMTCGLTGFLCGMVVSFFVFRWIIQTQIVPQIARHYAQSVPSSFDDQA